MITITLFAIAGFIFGYFKCKEPKEIKFVIAMVGGCIGMIVCWLLPCKLYVKETRVNIVSLQDNRGINGSFFLGIGSINDQMKYVFYSEKEPGVFEMKQINSTNVTIKYSDKPVFVTYKKIPITLWQFGLPVVDDIKYTIEVPKGTIQQNFNLDAK